MQAFNKKLIQELFCLQNNLKYVKSRSFFGTNKSVHSNMDA